MSYKFLPNMLKIFEDYESKSLPLFYEWICEQDNDARYYGIIKNKKGKSIFCYSDGKPHNGININKTVPLNLKEFTNILKKYKVEQEHLKKIFLLGITPFIRKKELSHSKIEHKVEQKRKNIEALLD